MPDKSVPAGGVELARRRLRATIRRYRTQAGLTQRKAAGQLGWSVSKLLRLEQGSPITPSDMRALLSLYRETDLDVVESLVTMVNQARVHTPYEEFADIASREYQELMDMEGVANVIYAYEPSVLPGLFQTEDYARHLSRDLGNGEDRVKRHAQLRMLRQANVIESTRPPELNVLLGEAALRRKVGSNKVMLEQFNRLVELAKQPDINLAVFPFAAGAHARMGTAFTVLQFDNVDLPDTLYREGAEGETIISDEPDNPDDPDTPDKPEEVRFYRDLFIELKERADKFPSFEEQLDEIRLYCFSRPERTSE